MAGIFGVALRGLGMLGKKSAKKKGTRMKTKNSTEYKTNKELEYHRFSIHAYRSSVSPRDWEDKVKELGYDAIRDGGINWYHFKTNCPEEKCIEIRKQLKK